MNPHDDRKPESADPEQMLRMLDLELMRQRALRKQAGARRNSWRILSFLFLFVVILGGLFAAYLAVTSGRVDELRARHDTASSPTPAVATRP